MKKVLVLLSTFNGEKYLETQIQSVLAQDYPELHLLVRDDGSTDGTLKLLHDFTCRYPDRIKIIPGMNLGYKDSFFALMEAAPVGYDYFAFCDQDDFWLPQKISQALRALQTFDQSKPLLYCSALTLTDKDLNIIGTTKINRQKVDYRSFFFSSIPTGSSSVFNDELKKIALTGKGLARNHDSWMLITASFFGEIFIDCNSFVLYRQHADNTLGLQLSPWHKFIGKLKRLLRKDAKFSNISTFARLFLQQYNELLSETQKIFLSEIAGYRQSLKKTLKLALSREVRTSHRYDTLAIRILILLHYI